MAVCLTVSTSGSDLSCNAAGTCASTRHLMPWCKAACRSIWLSDQGWLTAWKGPTWFLRFSMYSAFTPNSCNPSRKAVNRRSGVLLGATMRHMHSLCITVRSACPLQVGNLLRRDTCRQNTGVG